MVDRIFPGWMADTLPPRPPDRENGQIPGICPPLRISLFGFQNICLNALKGLDWPLASITAKDAGSQGNPGLSIQRTFRIQADCLEGYQKPPGFFLALPCILDEYKSSGQLPG